MVVSRPEVAEQMLLAGELPCPQCRGVLRPFGNGRTRTVRGIGTDTVTVTPRRARCADCRVTQVLLPTALTVRRADSTEAIGNALVARARGAGHRSITARFGAARVHRPTVVARCPRPVRAVVVPAGRRPRRRDRPRAAGPACTAAIGNALVAKAGGAGFRSIAARFGPVSYTHLTLPTKA